MNTNGKPPGPPSGSVTGSSSSAASTGPRSRSNSNTRIPPGIMYVNSLANKTANVGRIARAALEINNKKEQSPKSSSSGWRPRSNSTSSTNSLYSTGPIKRSESFNAYKSIMDDETIEEKMAFMNKIAKAAMNKKNKNEQPPKSNTSTTSKTPSVSNGSGFFSPFFSRLFPTSAKSSPPPPTPTKGGRRLSKRRKSQLKKRKRKTHRRRTA